MFIFICIYFLYCSQNIYYIKTDDNNLAAVEYKTEFIHQVESNQVLSVSENNTKEPITRIINGQQVQLINVPTNNTKQLTMKNPPPRSMVRIVNLNSKKIYK